MAFAKKIETKFVRFLYRKLEKNCIRNFTGSIQIAKQIQLKFDSALYHKKLCFTFSRSLLS